MGRLALLARVEAAAVSGALDQGCTGDGGQVAELPVREVDRGAAVQSVAPERQTPVGGVEDGGGGVVADEEAVGGGERAGVAEAVEARLGVGAPDGEVLGRKGLDDAGRGEEAGGGGCGCGCDRAHAAAAGTRCAGAACAGAAVAVPPMTETAGAAARTFSRERRAGAGGFCTGLLGRGRGAPPVGGAADPRGAEAVRAVRSRGCHSGFVRYVRRRAGETGGAARPASRSAARQPTPDPRESSTDALKELCR